MVIRRIALDDEALGRGERGEVDRAGEVRRHTILDPQLGIAVGVALEAQRRLRLTLPW